VSFSDRILAAQSFDPRQFLRWQVAGQHCGWINPAMSQRLARWPEIFNVGGDAVELRAELAAPAERTAALAEVINALRDEGIIIGWRNESYPVAAAFGGPPLLSIERAAAYHFGIRTRGAHLNGYTGNGSECRLWIGRRAASKPIEPLKLDNIVGGGVGLGFTPLQTILKECGEEAGIPPERARKVRERATIVSRVAVPEGLHWECIHSFDLTLDPDFTPVNIDGEVAEFRLLPIREVRELIRDTSEFTVDAALVTLDFMLRHEMAATTTSERAQLLAALQNTAQAWA
jgi:8-oxo-dGTP pyrophosphatase MutT (NUDIX family)